MDKSDRRHLKWLLGSILERFAWVPVLEVIAEVIGEQGLGCETSIAGEDPEMMANYYTLEADAKAAKFYKKKILKMIRDPKKGG